MAIVIRKNGALNSAMEGLAGGLQQGFGMGQSARSQDRADRQEQRAARESQTRQAAIEADAQRAAEQYMRENQERAAAQEAIAMPPLREPGPGASNKELGRYGKMAYYQTEVAKRMSPGFGSEWLKGKQKETKELAIDEDRKKLAQETGNEQADGAFFVPQVDGSTLQDPEIEKRVKKVLDYLAQPGSDPMKARSDLAGIQSDLVAAGGKMKSHQSALARMDQQISDIEANQQSPLLSSAVQSRKLHTLRELARVKPGNLEDKEFNKLWTNTVLGVEDIGDGDPVPLAYAEQARALKQRLAEADERNKQLYGEVLESQRRENDAQAKKIAAPEDPQDEAIKVLRRKQGARGEISDEAMDAEVERRTGGTPKGKSSTGTPKDTVEDRRSALKEKLAEWNKIDGWNMLPDSEKEKLALRWVTTGEIP